MALSDPNELWRRPSTRQRCRVSARDRNGSKRNCWRFEPGERCLLLDDSNGPGVVARILSALAAVDPFHVQNVRIRYEFDA